MWGASPSRKVLVKLYWLGPVMMALPMIPFSIASLAQRTSIRLLGWSNMRIFRLILVDCSFVGSARTDNSRMAPSCVDDCTSFSVKSSILLGAAMPDLFLVQSQLICVELPCSLRSMMLVMKGDKKGKKGLECLSFQSYMTFLEVKSIQAIVVPKTRKQLCQFIGMINFYRDIWQKC